MFDLAWRMITRSTRLLCLVMRVMCCCMLSCIIIAAPPTYYSCFVSLLSDDAVIILQLSSMQLFSLVICVSWMAAMRMMFRLCILLFLDALSLLSLRVRVQTCNVQFSQSVVHTQPCFLPMAYSSCFCCFSYFLFSRRELFLFPHALLPTHTHTHTHPSSIGLRRCSLDGFVSSLLCSIMFPRALFYGFDC